MFPLSNRFYGKMFLSDFEFSALKEKNKDKNLTLSLSLVLQGRR